MSLVIMLAGLVLATALGYHVVYGAHGYLAYRSERRQYLELRKKADTLKNTNDGLQTEVDALRRHDPAAIEKAARDQHYARPGEKIYTYTPADSRSNGTTAQPVNPPAPSSPPASPGRR
ncbi:MAG TPA: septum formation initiator family protein [Terriglobia bacterium]|nr:septum formation initiator family protein [Terriglobia bacterium]